MPFVIWRVLRWRRDLYDYSFLSSVCYLYYNIILRIYSLRYVSGKRIGLHRPGYLVCLLIVPGNYYTLPVLVNTILRPYVHGLFSHVMSLFHYVL